MADRSDNFTRADSASSIGSPSDGGSAYTLGSTGATGPTFGIAGNQGYLVNVGSGGATMVLDAGVTLFTPSVKFSGLGGLTEIIGVVQRWVDKDTFTIGYYRPDLGFAIGFVTGGSRSAITAWSGAATLSGGETWELRRIPTGNSAGGGDYWQLWVGGTLRQTTDANASPSYSGYTTATRGGVYFEGAAANVRFDDLFLDDPAAGGAAILTSPTGAATGNTTASGSVSTTGTDGTIWRKAQVGAATDPGAGNEAAAGWLSQSVSASGTQTFSSFGTLTTNVAVVANYLHVSAGGLRSSVATSGSFTPSTLGWTGTYPNQSGVAGAAFVHTGSIPTPTGGVGTKTYSATGLGASGLTPNPSTGQLQGTCGTAGTYNITPTVTDSSTAGTPNPQTASLSAFTLTISASGSPPTVSADPTNLTVATGATATFTGGFNGTPTLSLQWQEFLAGVWTAMGGQTTVNLALGTVTVGDTGRSFRLGCTNAFGGPIYTAAATLTVTAGSVGTITSDVLADWGNDTPLASLNIPFVTVERVSNANIALQLTNQITGTNGRLVVSNAAITTGVDYMLALRDAAGNVRGYKKYTAS